MTAFQEPGLLFEFADKNCFRIEKDPLVTHGYSSSTSNNMACECVSVIDGRHCFIEAKMSAPKGPGGSVKDLKLNGKSMPDTWTAFDNYTTFLRNIAKKFIDSFSILLSLSQGRHGSERLEAIQLPDKHLNLDHLRFILIINFTVQPGHSIDKQLMSVLQDALKNEMRPFLRIWHIPDTSVKVVLPEDAYRMLKVPVRLSS